MSELHEHPCVDCGEPTLNDERCRECGIALAFGQCWCCGGQINTFTPNDIGREWGFVEMKATGHTDRCAELLKAHRAVVAADVKTPTLLTPARPPTSEQLTLFGKPMGFT